MEKGGEKFEFLGKNQKREPSPLDYMYYVYVLKNSKSEKLYTGHTNNIKKRTKQHKSRNRYFKLIYFECYLSSRLARDRERKLKHYGSAWHALKNRINK